MNKEYLSKLKVLTSSHSQWQAFCDMLDYFIGLHHRKLEQASDTVEMYRSQGAITALRNMKYLKDEINAKQ